MMADLEPNATRGLRFFLPLALFRLLVFPPQGVPITGTFALWTLPWNPVPLGQIHTASAPPHPPNSPTTGVFSPMRVRSDPNLRLVQHLDPGQAPQQG